MVCHLTYMRVLTVLCCMVLSLTGFLCARQEAGTAREPLSPENWTKKLHEGDIVFIRSRSDNSRLIGALSSPSAAADADDVFTHCGILFNERGTWKVYEGAGRGT